MKSCKEVAKLVIRFLVKHEVTIRQCLGRVSIFPFTYGSHHAIFYFGHGLMKKHGKWELARALFITRLSTLGLTIVAMFIGHIAWYLVTRYDRWMIRTDKKHKKLKFFLRALGYAFRFLAIVGFAVLSAWLASKGKDTQVYLRMLCSYVGFVLLLCMAFWSPEEFGAADAFMAVALGYMILRKNDQQHWFHTILGASIPALRHIGIPSGTCIAKWASASDDGDDIEPSDTTEEGGDDIALNDIEEGTGDEIAPHDDAAATDLSWFRDPSSWFHIILAGVIFLVLFTIYVCLPDRLLS